MDLQLDHVVIVVSGLGAATQDYQGLGFTVTPGGEHKVWGTRNALIPFADGSYLELIEFRKRSAPTGTVMPKDARRRQLNAEGRAPLDCRVLTWETAGEGLVDFALVPDRIQDAINNACSMGLMVEGPFSGGRVRPDGQKVLWWFGIPIAPGLPFLCADETPRSLRVPEGAARRHANGVKGVQRIVVGVRNLRVSAAGYQALLGARPRQGAGYPLPDAQTVDFALGPAMVTLAAPTGGESPLSEEVNRRGEGPVALVLRTSGKASRGPLESSKTRGARIELASD